MMNNPNKIALSVIVPTYNEAPNIQLLISELSRVLEEVSHEIIVVDDDSPDGTAEIVARERENNPFVHLIHRKDQRGLTSALQAGIFASRGSVVGWLDSDFQHPPLMVRTLFEAIQSGVDVASGSRFLKPLTGDKRVMPDSDTPAEVRLHGQLSHLLSLLISLLVHKKLTDWTSGLIVIRKEIFDDYSLKGFYGEYFISLLEHCVCRGYRIVEIPYTLDLRVAGVSKSSGGGYLRLFILGFRYLVVVSRILYARIFSTRL